MQPTSPKPPTGPPVPFSSLPLNKSNTAAVLNAWGAHGPNDELGFLNRLTDDIVVAAAAEIRDGTRVGLDAPLDFQGDKPLFGRQVFKKDVYQKKPRFVHDDTWHFNTQSSTQWDGLRHFGYQKAERFYNNTTVEDIAGTSEKAQSRKDILGIQNFARKGIVGRGVLVDFARWADGPGKDIVDRATDGKGYQSFERSVIKHEWLIETLKYQGTEIKWGDILFTRTAFMRAYKTISPEKLDALHKVHPNPPTVGGVEASKENLEWIWNNFSAVAGDQPGFEAIPMEQPNSAHEILLGGWGCPIGELFDLEGLSKVCEEKNRWTFFLTSEPVNVPGGVASPPNALAIF
ncbi:hypothetical protein R6Q59_009947 [Mikania micrantha]